MLRSLRSFDDVSGLLDHAVVMLFDEFMNRFGVFKICFGLSDVLFFSLDVCFGMLNVASGVRFGGGAASTRKEKE